MFKLLTRESIKKQGKLFGKKKKIIKKKKKIRREIKKGKERVVV